MSVADSDEPAGAGAVTVGRTAERDWSRMVASTGSLADLHPLRMRLLRSELGMVFRRRRNQVALAFLAAVPVFIALAVRLSSPPPNGEGPPFLDQVTHNGVFVAFTALTVLMTLFLPLVVAVVAGDGVAGEASLGTLRYLLTVPVGRTRLLVVKYLGIVAFCLAATLLVAAAGTAVGLVLFGNGSAVLLSGNQVGLAAALWRLLLVVLYVAGSLAAVGAIGLFVSTTVEAPMAAMATTAGACIVSQILDAVPQISAVHPYLPSHYWLSFGDLLRQPIATEALRPGILSVVVYVALFFSLAWARFGGKDVTS